ncbi:MAG: type I-F CRISPR-associated protein Csy3 [Desulfobacteraceae bacterium]|nr:type I-F CRISPR-associated protein Csy3 [Desulfobacteraceae bacterium]
MATKIKKDKMEIPSMLNYSRSIVPSNGLFTYLRGQDVEPVLIQQQTVRGTISNYSNVHKKKGEDNLEKQLDPERANIQTIDVCYLPNDIDTFFLNFSVKFLNNTAFPGACNVQRFQAKLTDFFSVYKKKKGFTILAELYLKNIINARWFWRNRVSIEKSVKIVFDDKEFIFMPSNDLQSAVRKTEQKNFDLITGKIAKALAGDAESFTINVTGSGNIGSGQEIYPSQDFIENKKGKFLAYVDHEKGKQAQMHSQKIGNAIRTIDSWYPLIDDNPDPSIFPAPIEPYGVIQQFSVATRLPSKNKSDLYSHLLNLDSLIDDCQKKLNNDHHYVMACLIKGGVFSGSSK